MSSPASEALLPTSGPRVVAFGGGTGMSCLLSGLKHFTPHITAIVAVTDNGGSSGRLRKEFDMVPPGDIRSCLLALAEGDPLLANLLRYRFEESVLDGHNFGNLFITALTRVTGSFDHAIRELNDLLRVRGKVLPATSRKISLIAQHPDGSKSTGEVQVSSADKPISGVEIQPRVRKIASDVDQAIRAAELMVFGPGSLFTSVIPNLLVDPIRAAIAANSCQKVYVANIMTQPGETTGMSLNDHVAALDRHGGKGLISAVVVHEGKIPEHLVDRYSREDAHLVTDADDPLDESGVQVIRADLVDPAASTVRHESRRLSQLIVETFAPGCQSNLA